MRNSGCSRPSCTVCRSSRRERPVLVVLDDLQWADAPSLRLLGFLARALTGSRVLLVGAYRDAEAANELLAVSTSAQHLPLRGPRHRRGL